MMKCLLVALLCLTSTRFANAGALASAYGGSFGSQTRNTGPGDATGFGGGADPWTQAPAGGRAGGQFGNQGGNDPWPSNTQTGNQGGRGGNQGGFNQGGQTGGDPWPQAGNAGRGGNQFGNTGNQFGNTGTQSGNRGNDPWPTANNNPGRGGATDPWTPAPTQGFPQIPGGVTFPIAGQNFPIAGNQGTNADPWTQAPTSGFPQGNSGFPSGQTATGYQPAGGAQCPALSGAQCSGGLFSQLQQFCSQLTSSVGQDTYINGLFSCVSRSLNGGNCDNAIRTSLISDQDPAQNCLAREVDFSGKPQLCTFIQRNKAAFIQAINVFGFESQTFQQTLNQASSYC